MAIKRPKADDRETGNPLAGSAGSPTIPLNASPSGAAPDPVEAGEFSVEELKPLSQRPISLAKSAAVRGTQDVAAVSAEEPLQDMPQISTIKYRSARGRGYGLHLIRRVGLFGIALLVLLAAVAYYFVRTDRGFNQRAVDSIRRVQKQLEKHEPGARTRPFTDRLLQHVQLAASSDSGTTAAQAWRDMDCRFLIQEALTRRFRKTLDPTGQYLLTSCQLAQDVPQSALRQASEIHGDAARFQRDGNSWEMLPMQLLMAEAQRRMQTFNLVAPKNHPNCRRWAASPACFLKFVELARQPVRSRLDDAHAVLIMEAGRHGPMLQAWLAWAAAWNQTKLGDGVQVERLLKEAAELFPAHHDPFVEREIFRLRMFNALRLRDKKLAELVWRKRPVALMTADEAGFLDVKLMRALLGRPEHSSAAMEEFLRRPESFQRYRFDPDFIRLVISQTIRQRRAVDGLAYLDRIQEQQDDQKTLDGERLPLLRVRLLIAQGMGLEALKILQSIEKTVVRSQEVLHLKGSAMLQAYSSKNYRLLAAAEFQKAANLEPRAEHFFALIVSFLDGRDFSKAESVFRFWKKLKAKPGDGDWQNLAQGLLHYGQGREAAALQLWNELARRNPGFIAVHSLLTNLQEDPNYLKDQPVKKIMSMLPVDGPLSPLAVF